MKYLTWYNKLITYRHYNIPNGYVERHHIIPSSLGGSDNSDNIIALTAREHFIAHLLLSKIYPTGSEEHIKMCYALNRMKDFRQKYQITSRQYDYIRKQHADNMRKTKGQRKWITNGTNNKFIYNCPTVLEQGWTYGNTHSVNHAAKLNHSRSNRDSSNAIEAMRKVSIGRNVTESTRKKLSKANTGKTLTKVTKQKMSTTRKGVPKSDDHKKKIASALTGKRHSAQRKAKISKTYILVRPDNVQITITNLKQFCNDNLLRYMTMRSFIGTNDPIPPSSKSTASQLRHNCTGWKIFEVK